MLSFIISFACARYSDIAQLIISGIQLCFFLTPILWPISALGGYSYLVNFNIFYHMVDIIRLPLMGEMPNIFSYFFLLISAIIFSIVTVITLTRYKKSIPYWI